LYSFCDANLIEITKAKKTETKRNSSFLKYFPAAQAGLKGSETILNLIIINIAI
jgi:hypothetical protein